MGTGSFGPLNSKKLLEKRLFFGPNFIYKFS
jgi:hypothetical protein